MKTVYLIILSVFLLSLMGIYIYIPKEIKIQKTVVIKAPERILLNYLDPQKGWKKWWPQNNRYKPGNTADLQLSYKEADFTFKQQSYYTIDAISHVKDLTSKGAITFFAADGASTRVIWNSIVPTSKNPIKRISQYLVAKKTVVHIHEILNHLKSYSEDDNNTYGISIRKSTVVDTIVLTTKITSSDPPGEKAIYVLINDLRNYIKSTNAKETNFPVYNITKINSGEYQTMVGIPISKTLQKKGDIVTKKMIQANVLITEVRGGRNTVANAISQLEQYIIDKGLSSPAIPFASLLTNRMNEADTSNWITRIYYPIY